MEYLTKTLTNGKVKAVCTIDLITNACTYCLFTPSNDDWEPPCQVCTLKNFYRDKAHFFKYTAWKGVLVREEDEES